MDDGATLKFVNKHEFFLRLRRISPTLNRELASAALDGANEVASLARSFSQSTRVRNTIVVEPRPETLGAIVAMGDASTQVEVREGSGIYSNIAIFEEFGTKPHRVGGMFAGALHPGTKPRPALFPAFRLLKKKIMARFREAFRIVAAPRG